VADLVGAAASAVAADAPAAAVVRRN